MKGFSLAKEHPLRKDALQFFKTAEEYVKANFKSEMDYVEFRKFEDMTIHDFVIEYIYVVLNTGMKNQVAEKIFFKLKATGDLSLIHHLGKQKAIREVIQKSFTLFDYLKKAENKLAYLETLPFIGPVTKYHLARNLGLDYAKPDRHLEKLSKRFNYTSVQTMCAELAKESGYRIGTVDVILWRYSNMKGQERLLEAKK